MLRNKVFSGPERSNQPHFLEPEPKPNLEKVPPLFNSMKAEGRRPREVRKPGKKSVNWQRLVHEV